MIFGSYRDAMSHYVTVYNEPSVKLHSKLNTIRHLQDTGLIDVSVLNRGIIVVLQHMALCIQIRTEMLRT